jgi:hypothetical protein
MYVKFRDLIEYAYWTWNFSFDDVQTDLIDILQLAIKDGINAIGLPNDKVVYLTEFDLLDMVDYLSDYVYDILHDIKYESEYENEI